MADVLLFFPKIAKTEESILLPVSLLMVAAPLVNKGFTVKIIDQRVQKNWRESLLTELTKKPLVVGFSVLAGQQILYALEASKIVKERGSSLVVWGGVHASLLPEQTLENKFIDIVVVGEGERPFLDLCERLKNNQNYEHVQGLAYKKEGEFFITPPGEFINLDSLPETPYHLVEIEKYIRPTSFASGRPARNIFFCTSRGCPHNCGFCYNKNFNKRTWRAMSAERVFKEISRFYNQYGIDTFDFEDDEFFVDLERVRKLSELIIENDLKIEIFTSCRLNYLDQMDDEYLRLIKRAGFVTLSFGVETGSPRLILLIDKDITINQIFSAIKRLAKIGIDSKYYFMVGFPTEGLEDMYDTTDLIQKMKQMNPGLRIPAWRTYTPYVNTDLLALSFQQGFRLPLSLEDWAKFEYDVVNMPWLDWRARAVIKNVIFLSKYLEIDKSIGRGFFFKLAQIYSRMVNWRWRHHFFTFVPEKYLIQTALEAKRPILKIIKKIQILAKFA